MRSTETANTGPLAGKTAVVTGASKGIGRAIALRLAAAGAELMLHTRADRQRLAETASLTGLAESSIARCFADLAEQEGRDRLVATAFEWRDEIDIWVNNAGADVLTGDRAQETFDAKLAHLLEVDVRGTIAVSRSVGQRMKQRGAGCLIQIGWDQAIAGMGGDSGEMFAATKGAVMSFTRSLAKTLAPEVRVNCVAPGWIQTEWGATASPEWDARAKRESLLGRWGRPEDVAAAVEFLASPAADFINGQVLEVNGGFQGAEPS